MKRSEIKKFAIQARIMLMKQVSKKCNDYGIYKQDQGILLLPYHGNKEEIKQRQNLILKIDDTSFDQVVEEVAYIWFNRFIALRYMEVNGYLPYNLKIFTNQNNEFKPEIIDQVMDLNIQGIDDQIIYNYILNNDNEALYRYLLISICNDMNHYLPALFKKLSDECILLLPDHLLDDDSIISKMIHMLDEQLFNDQVEIIGWLYQYYNSEIKEQVIDINKTKMNKHEIPYATQVFTPDWIVSYLVENSLGKYYLQRKHDSKLKTLFHYYIDDQLVIDENIDLKQIKVLDPCMGSGHILVYAFEVLLQMYLELGYDQKDAVELILDYNLYGFDIDKRAFQLAYFALMMKARKYHEDILNKPRMLNIIELKESDIVSEELLKNIAINDEYYQDLTYLKQIYTNSKELGSIIQLQDKPRLYNINKIKEDSKEKERFNHLLKQYQLMNDKYQVVITNPPYMNKYEGCLKQYVNEYYKDYNGDLFSIFMIKNLEYATYDGYCGFMTPFVWMFIKTYEKLRKYLCEYKSIISLVQMEYGAFKEAMVPICCFVLSNQIKQQGTFIRLSEFHGGMSVQQAKLLEAINNQQCNYLFKRYSYDFLKLSNCMIAYWLNDQLIHALKHSMKLKDFASACVGLQSGNNERFLRLWYEVDYYDIAFIKQQKKKYYLINKGGNYRKWYGNEEYVIDYENDGERLKQAKGSVLRNSHHYFKEHITWSKVSSGKISFRYKRANQLFDIAGPSIFSDDHHQLLYLLGLLNSNIIDELLKALSPTMNYEVGQIASLPIIYDQNYQEEVITLVNDCINISKEDYDEKETSYEFKKHVLVKKYDDDVLLLDLYHDYELKTQLRFEQLKQNEIKLNQIFNQLYQMNTNVVIEDKYLKLNKITKLKVVKTLISYLIGVCFKRYDINQDYLQYKQDIILYTVDELIIMIKDYLKKIFGSSTYEANLAFINEQLGYYSNIDDSLYQYLKNDFYLDHYKMYMKRPIYWQFTSGKHHEFDAFMCIHNCNQDLYDQLLNKINNKDQSKEIKTYQDKILACDKQIFNFDLNDGVALNYRKLQMLLRKWDK